MENFLSKTNMKNKISNASDNKMIVFLFPVVEIKVIVGKLNDQNLLAKFICVNICKLRMMSDVEEEPEKARKSLQISRHKVFDLSVTIQTVKSIHLS